MIGAESTPTFGYYNPASGGADPSFFGQAQAAMSSVGQGVGMGLEAAGAGFQTAGQFAVGAYNQLGALGQQIRPFFKAMPQDVATGHGGLYMQPTGFFQGASYAAGFGHAPKHATPMEYGYAMSSDFGERVGGGAAAAGLMAAPIAAGAAMSMAPGFKTIGAIPSALAKRAGAAVGGSIGSAFGATGLGWGAAAGGFIGMVLPGIAAYGVIDTIQDAVQDRLVNQSMLEAGSFRFTGAGSEMSGRLGAGMGRESRREASEFIRQLDIKESFFGDDEMRQILQKSTSLGLFTSAGGSMDNFKKRFTDIKDGVKTMMKTLNVTLEEGLNTMGDLSTVGITTAQAPGMAKMADALGRASGRTGQEMITLGMQGAEMYRGTGISMDIGFQANMMNVASIRAARDAGWISKQVVSQLGGEESAGQQMTHQGKQYGQSNIGRGAMSSFYDPSTGGFNTDLFNRNIRRGGESVISLATRGARAMARPKDLIRYQARQEDFLSEAGEQFGGRGLQLGQYTTAMSFARMYNSTTGASMEDSFLYSLKMNMGMSDPQAKLAVGQIKGRQSIFEAAQAGASATSARLQSEQAAKRSATYQMGEKLKDYWADYISDPIAKPIVSKINDFQDFIQDMTERNRGLITVKTSDIDTEVISQAYTSKEQTDAETMYRNERTPADLSKLGRSWGMGRSVGDDIAKGMQRGIFGEKYTRLATYPTSEAGDNDMVTLKSMGGLSSGVTRDKWNEMQKVAENLSVTLPEARRLEKRGELKTVFGGISMPDLQEMVAQAYDDRKVGLGEETLGEVTEKIVGDHMYAISTTSISAAFNKMLDRQSPDTKDREIKLAGLRGELDLKQTTGARREEINAEIQSLQKAGMEIRNKESRDFISMIRNDPHLIDLFGKERLDTALKGVGEGETLSATSDSISRVLKFDVSNLAKLNISAMKLSIERSGAGRSSGLQSTQDASSLAASGGRAVRAKDIVNARNTISEFRKEMGDRLGFELGPKVVEALAAKSKRLENVEGITADIAELTEAKANAASDDDKAKIGRQIEVLRGKRTAEGKKAKAYDRLAGQRQGKYLESEGASSEEIEAQRKVLSMYSSAGTDAGAKEIQERFELLTKKKTLKPGEEEELDYLKGMTIKKIFSPDEVKVPTALASELREVSGAVSTVRSGIAGEGSVTMAAALNRQLIDQNSKMSTASIEELVAKVSLASSAPGLDALTRKDLKAVSGTDIGKWAITTKDTLKRLDAMDPIKVTADAFIGQIADKDQRSSLAKIYKDQKDGDDKSGRNAFVSAAVTQFQAKDFTTGAGSSGGVEQEAALENLKVQTNLNLGYLLALSGLAAQMGITLKTSSK